MATTEEMAHEYVAEYLSNRPEFIDMVEYLDYEYPDLDLDEGYNKAWEEVLGLLDNVEQRFADEDS